MTNKRHRCEEEKNKPGICGADKEPDAIEIGSKQYI
jgi:hypothetical protein